LGALLRNDRSIDGIDYTVTIGLLPTYIPWTSPAPARSRPGTGLHCSEECMGCGQVITLIDRLYLVASDPSNRHLHPSNKRRQGLPALPSATHQSIHKQCTQTRTPRRDVEDLRAHALGCCCCRASRGNALLWSALGGGRGLRLLRPVPFLPPWLGLAWLALCLSLMLCVGRVDR
jgi:hypothetical protein